MRRYVNEGHDIKSAGDMKAAIVSYVGVKVCQAAVVKIQESCQTMRMSEIQSWNNFSFESEGLRVLRAYNVGPGKAFHGKTLERIWDTTRTYRPTGRKVLQCTTK